MDFYAVFCFRFWTPLETRTTAGYRSWDDLVKGEYYFFERFINDAEFVSYAFVCLAAAVSFIMCKHLRFNSSHVDATRETTLFADCIIWRSKKHHQRNLFEACWKKRTTSWWIFYAFLMHAMERERTFIFGWVMRTVDSHVPEAIYFQTHSVC